MTNPNELNLPEFDTEAYLVAQELEIPEAFEIAVAVETQENEDFIPIEDIDISGLGE